MTIGMKEFNELKAQAENCQRKADKAQGALDQTMKVLKDDYGCDNIEEAKELVKKETRETNKLKSKFEMIHKEFMDKWEEKLND